MAVLMSSATGNLTAAGTWKSCIGFNIGTTFPGGTLATYYSDGAVHTPGAITVEGIAIKVAVRATSPSGTFSIKIKVSGGADVAGTETSVNVSDFGEADSTANAGSGWNYIKFASPVTLIAATNYVISVKTSVSTQMQLYSSGGSSYSFYYKTSTTAAPVASDQLMILGEVGGSTYTVTMNNTAATTYGACFIGNKGILECANAASTVYEFRTRGIECTSGGTMNINITPSSTLLAIRLMSTSPGSDVFAVRHGFNLTLTGYARTNYRSYMTADKISSATSISVTDTSTWVAGDVLIFPPDIRTHTSFLEATISSVTNSTTVAITGTLGGSKSGTAPTAVEVFNYSRNVFITGNTSTNTGAMVFTGSKGNIDIRDTIFRWMGAASTGVTNNRTADSIGDAFSMTRCVSYGCTLHPLSMAIGTATDHLSYQNSTHGIVVPAGVAGPTLTRCTALRSNSNGFNILGTAGTYINLKAAGSGGTGAVFTSLTTMGISGYEGHSNLGGGISVTASGLTSSPQTHACGVTVWRNTTYGASVTVGGSDINVSLGWTGFGNSTVNYSISGSGSGNISMNNVVSNAGSTLTCPIGLEFNSFNFDLLTMVDCTFGATTAHATGDLKVTTGGTPSIFLSNCTLASTTEVATQTLLTDFYPYDGIISDIHDTNVGIRKSWKGAGTMITDLVIYNLGTSSLRMTPNSLTRTLIDYKYQVIVEAGATTTPLFYVRKSVVGDAGGAAYNGREPRLMLRANPSMGIMTDTIIDTATAASIGSWEALTGTSPTATARGTMEFYIDCTGTTGWINVETIIAPSGGGGETSYVFC